MDRDASLNADQRRIKEQFVAEYGDWNPGLSVLLQIDHEFVEVIREYLAHPWSEGSLPSKEKALVHTAVNAAPTTLSSAGIRYGVGTALDHGASVEELTEVVEIVFILGIHSITIGVPILVEEVGLPETFTEEEHREHERLKREWLDRRGFWSDARYDRMVVDPGHFGAYLDASAYPWEHGVLKPKVKELIYVAIDGSPTHLFETGLQLHVRNALEQGASRAEIVEALQIASSIGLHSVRAAMPIIAEEADRRGLR